MIQIPALTEEQGRQVKHLLDKFGGSTVTREQAVQRLTNQESGVVICNGRSGSLAGYRLYECQRRIYINGEWEDFGTNYLVDANNQELETNVSYRAAIVGRHNDKPLWAAVCCGEEDLSSSSSSSSSRSRNRIPMPSGCSLTNDPPDTFFVTIILDEPDLGECACAGNPIVIEMPYKGYVTGTSPSDYLHYWANMTLTNPVGTPGYFMYSDEELGTCVTGGEQIYIHAILTYDPRPTFCCWTYYIGIQTHNISIFCVDLTAASNGSSCNVFTSFDPYYGVLGNVDGIMCTSFNDSCGMNHIFATPVISAEITE